MNRVQHMRLKWPKTFSKRQRWLVGLWILFVGLVVFGRYVPSAIGVTRSVFLAAGLISFFSVLYLLAVALFRKTNERSDDRASCPVPSDRDRRRGEKITEVLRDLLTLIQKNSS